MTKQLTLITTKSDPAAEFMAALSLYKKCQSYIGPESLSDVYSGFDECQRQCARIGKLFEHWACEHVDFDALDDVWPYMLEESFGSAVVKFLQLTELDRFDESYCKSVARKLRLPMRD